VRLLKAAGPGSRYSHPGYSWNRALSGSKHPSATVARAISQMITQRCSGFKPESAGPVRHYTRVSCASGAWACPGGALIRGEIPRLCRGGSRSLTDPAVCFTILAIAMVVEDYVCAIRETRDEADARNRKRPQASNALAARRTVA
jgi:hypothetical protein